MKLTRQTNYAVRVLMYCAANDGRLSHVPEIAKAYGISEVFLFKVLKPLTTAGLIETMRGRNGGIRLGRAPKNINLFDVVTATENGFLMAECFEHSEPSDCPLIGGCSLNSALTKALESFFAVLRQHSIHDLIASRGDIRFLLGIDTRTVRTQH